MANVIAFLPLCCFYLWPSAVSLLPSLFLFWQSWGMLNLEYGAWDSRKQTMFLEKEARCLGSYQRRWCLSPRGFSKALWSQRSGCVSWLSHFMRWIFLGYSQLLLYIALITGNIHSFSHSIVMRAKWDINVIFLGNYLGSNSKSLDVITILLEVIPT